MFGEILLTIATEKIGDKLLAGINAKLNPGELETSLKQAIKAADGTQPGGLFHAFPADGPQGYSRFLNQFFQGRALEELRKPLAGHQGALDIDFLAKAFAEEASQHAKLKAIERDKIEPWLQVFTETYFQSTNRFLQFQVIREDYCDQIRRVFDDVKFAGIAVEGQDIDRAERLADIFVMPDVEEEEGSRPTLTEAMPPEDFETSQQRLLWEQQQQVLQAKQRSGGRKFSAADLLVKGRTNRAVLLGAPGSGKTTLMNYFAVVCTSQSAEVTAQESVAPNRQRSLRSLPFATRLPILIRIRDLARHPDRSILEFIREFSETDLAVTRNLTGFFEYYLENDNALILLDGLDEVAEVAQRYKVVEKIEAFLNQYQRCPAIITSRPAGYKRDFFRTDEYPHYELQLFDEKKIDTFIDYWYNSRFELESERERRKTSLRKALKDQPRIQQLARNPLLLTIIALIHRYQAKLPKERYKLYDKAVETLLTTWDSQKELSNHEVLEYLELDDLRRLMERLAYWIHDQGGTGDSEGGTLIDREELIAQLSQYIGEMKQVERYQAKAEAKRFLEQIVRDRAGLLSLQGQDRYAFVHKTFQEYLTAMEIRDRQEEGFEVVLEHIEQHLHDPHWEEVLLLLIAQQKRSNPAKILKAILNRDTPYEPWLHRNLLFAGKVLAENVPVADTGLAKSIIQDLFALEVSKSPLVTKMLREKVLDIISSLYETAFESIALEQLSQNQEVLNRWRFLEYQGALDTSQATQTLVNLLKDADARVRSRGVLELAKLGQSSEEVIEGLLRLLNDADAKVRSRMALALAELGQSSDEVIEGLLGLLNDDDSYVRSSAAASLGKLGQPSTWILGELLKLLSDPNSSVRSSVARALGKLSQTAEEEIVEELLKLLQDANSSVRSGVAEALGELDQTSHVDKALPVLLKLLSDEDSSVRFNTALALKRLGQTSEEIEKDLLVLLTDADSYVCSGAAMALSELGQVSEKILEALLNLLKNTDEEMPYHKAWVVWALGWLNQTSEQVGEVLLRLLSDKVPSVRSRAAEALGRLGQTSSVGVVEALLGLLADSDSSVRSKAAEALGRLGQISAEIVEALLGLLPDADSFVCSKAAEALIALGKCSNQVESLIVHWIEQNQTEDYIGAGVDVLGALVS